LGFFAALTGAAASREFLISWFPTVFRSRGSKYPHSGQRDALLCLIIALHFGQVLMMFSSKKEYGGFTTREPTVAEL
jgi:hypothetical protein